MTPGDINIGGAFKAIAFLGVLIGLAIGGAITAAIVAVVWWIY